MKPRRFALTPGEPAGIGPDLCLLLAAQPQPYPLIAITSHDLLIERAARLGVRGEQQAQVGTYAGWFAGCQSETSGFHFGAWSTPGSLIST